MIEVTDDRGVTIRLQTPPTRIVSLVPSTTETVCALGCADRLVGVTRFCVHPADVVARLPRIGGTKDVITERVAALQPDLILGNCEENTREIFEALAPIAPVYAAFPKTVDDAVRDLLRLADVLGVDADPVVARIDAARAQLTQTPLIRALYLIWRDPWMAAGPDTFISDMLAQAGILNALPSGGARFPVVEAQAIAALAPDIVLLSSEPFPFAARHIVELSQLTGLPQRCFYLVDGEACSWHGARMAHGLGALASLRAEIAERA